PVAASIFFDSLLTSLFSMKRIYGPILIFFFFFTPLPLEGEEKPRPVPIPWQILSPGLSFYRWEVHSQNVTVNTLAILRIDPELWSFRVFFNREPKTIKEWHQSTGATILCNGGFYQENFNPAGRILVNGTSLGPFKNRHMKGMFLAEPQKGFEHLPKAALIDLKDDKSEEIIASYSQGVQSFPILLDPKGQVRVNQSNFQANRTVLAQDGTRHLYIIITEKPLFTLYNLGHYLKALPFGFQFILNLDGGNRTQLLVQIKAFKYLFTGQGEGSDPTRFFFGEQIRLPSVIGIFPRGRH
ncbi:MAG: phosphodiester glycosidase family protein, partial [Deltaproteobacteria bacterium]|nr:phosphodiester glycosidase family protein [Deltaproteobacteria bacterium]